MRYNNDMQSLEYVTVLIGATLPALSFLMQYHFSAKAGTLDAFKRHQMVYWGDWLLVPFAAIVGLLVNWANIAWLLAPCLKVNICWPSGTRLEFL